MNKDMLVYTNKLKDNIKLLISQNRLDETKEILNLYENIARDGDIDIYSIKSIITMIEGNYEEAERILVEGLDRDEENFDLLYNLAYLYQSDGRYELAIKYYKRASQNAKEEKDTVEIYKILQDLGVKENENQCVENDKNHDKYNESNAEMNTLGELESYKKQFKDNIQQLIKQGLLEEARKMIDQYDTLIKDDIDIYSVKGVISMIDGNMDEAERVLREGLKIDPDSIDIMHNLAYLYDNTPLECKALAMYYYKRCLSITKSQELKDELDNQISKIKKNLFISCTSRKPLVSIVVLAYNKLEYTKMCVQSIYKYTSHIDFELITVNNGSCDGTEAFFNSLPNTKKINIKNNVGGVNGFNAGLFWAEGKYLVYVGNDLILTKNWLDNMIKCIESDPSIGFVSPGSNILSNYQDIPVSYTNIEEMHEFAENYNVSDPKKWEERIRIMPLTMIIKKDIFDRTGGIDHRYYMGEFSDDDFSLIVRRMGYKLIYAADTFIHHFGSITGGENKRNNNSLGISKKIFIDKFNIDPWKEMIFDDAIIKNINVFEDYKEIRIMGINCFCGGTPLQVKNLLLSRGINRVDIINYTSNSKYEVDLKTVSNKTMVEELDKIRFFGDIENLNYIIIESDFHEIKDIESFFTNLQSMVSNKYQVIIKLENPNYYINIYNTFIHSTELIKTHINLYNLIGRLKKINLGEVEVISILEDESTQNNILKSIYINGEGLNTQQTTQLLTQYYIISIVKN